MAPIVTLTTDFGLEDAFVGVMKGVILGICPEARLVDLSHMIDPHDVVGAQIVLEAAVGFFPAGTVHLGVVDPGVGSERRALALDAGGQFLVGPDNGLFTFALEGGPWRAVRLDAAEYRLSRVSPTFHGRDVFAPAAAHLARGLPLERLGEAIGDPIRRPLPRARIVGETLIGEVLRADHFGNLTTSVTAEDLASFSTGGTLVVEWDGHALGEPVTTFADGSLDRPACLMGSSGRLEIFVREGSAAALLGAGRGSRVRIRRG